MRAPAAVVAALAGLLTALPAPAHAERAAPGEPTWERPPGVPDQALADPALDPRTGDVFVATTPWSTRPDTLTRVDGRTGEVVWSLNLPAGRQVTSVLVDAPRRRLVVTGWPDVTDDRTRGYVAALDLDGHELWHRDDLSPAPESRVQDVAVDSGTGQLCLVSEEPTDVTRPRQDRTKSLACFASDGTPVFSHAWTAPVEESLDNVAIDDRTHQVLVSGPDDRGAGTSTNAYSATGTPLWRRHLGQRLTVHDLLVDPRRRRVHVVGSTRSGRAFAVGYDTGGAKRFRTTWKSPVDRVLEPHHATVLPRTGRVVVTAFAGSRLLVQALESSGRTAARSVVRGTFNAPQAVVDPRNGRVLVSVNRGTGIYTSAQTLKGRRLWEHRFPTRSIVGVTRGVLDPRRGRFTFVVRARKHEGQVVQLRS